MITVFNWRRAQSHCEVCCGELGAPTTDCALSSPTLSMEAGGIRRDSGRTTARVRAMRPVCKSVVLLCGRDWTLERVRAKDEERFRDLRPRHLLRRLAGPGTMFLPTRINPEKPVSRALTFGVEVKIGLNVYVNPRD